MILRFVVATVFPVLLLAQQGSIGVFEAQGDVGENPKAGSAEFDMASAEYRVTGGGANIWASVDAFHFLWKRISGDVTLTADVKFVGSGAVAHRKAVLMIRQNLNPDSAYADVSLHGDGLTSLQFRPKAGEATSEMRAEVNMPARIRIERRGNEFRMSAGKAGEELKATGPASVVLEGAVYVGIGVCSHDADVLETAIFSNVRIETGN